MELADKDLTLFTSFKVTSADTDMEARLRPGALLNYLIQAAISSADSLGFGFGGIRKQQLFWVLSRITVEIYRPLKWYETVEVETWPKNVERIIYLRDFILRDEKKEIVAKATSGWLAVDLESKRPKRIDGLHAEIFERLRGKSAVDESPEKLPSVEKTDYFQIKSTYFDIDLNRHVTSTRYIDWMLDSFQIKFNLRNYPKKMSVNYIKETGPEESVRIYRHEVNPGTYSFEGINEARETTAFRGKIEF